MNARLFALETGQAIERFLLVIRAGLELKAGDDRAMIGGFAFVDDGGGGLPVGIGDKEVVDADSGVGGGKGKSGLILVGVVPFFLQGFDPAGVGRVVEIAKEQGGFSGFGESSGGFDEFFGLSGAVGFEVGEVGGKDLEFAQFGFYGGEKQDALFVFVSGEKFEVGLKDGPA